MLNDPKLKNEELLTLHATHLFLTHELSVHTTEGVDSLPTDLA